MTSNLGVLGLKLMMIIGFDDLGPMVQRHWLVEHVRMNKVRDLARMFLSKSHGKLGQFDRTKGFRLCLLVG